MGTILQIIGVGLAITGASLDVGVLFIIGGILCIILDTIGFFNGSLNPLLPIILYIGGYLSIGGWNGILWGAIVSNSLEILFFIILLIGGGSYALFSKIKEKSSSISNSEVKENTQSKDDDWAKKFFYLMVFLGILVLLIFLVDSK